MILSNQIRCNHCKDEIFSSHVHDFKYCTCGAVAVDGGMGYLRRLCQKGPKDYTDMSITIDDNIFQAAKDAVKWGMDTGRNELGIVCAIFRAFRDQGVNLHEFNTRNT